VKEGILLVDKPKGRTSFHLVYRLRKLLGVQKIGHAGTLDPFATGVMVMLIGRNYTRKSSQFLEQDKEYVGRVRLGAETDTYDSEGTTLQTSDTIPTQAEIEEVLTHFQGKVQQVPPMYSAKKVNGKKLYELARAGKTIEREPKEVQISLELLSYRYPDLDIRVTCSKGTYIRSIAHDIGQKLGCGAHLTELCRSRSGQFGLEQCLDGALLEETSFDVRPHLKVS
jgi:tRNA pseudouridine55 synthase